jgi:hypothetical protein
MHLQDRNPRSQNFYLLCDVGLGIKASAISFDDSSRSQGRKMVIVLRPCHLA